MAELVGLVFIVFVLLAIVLYTCPELGASVL
jgi:hypothetical protein